MCVAHGVWMVVVYLTQKIDLTVTVVWLLLRVLSLFLSPVLIPVK
jgi:hypothetical protein